MRKKKQTWLNVLNQNEFDKVEEMFVRTDFNLKKKKSNSLKFNLG